MRRPGSRGPTGGLSIHEYAPVVLSPFAVRRFEMGHVNRFTTGAVYHRNRLVRESLRQSSPGDHAVAEDPERLPRDLPWPWRLRGRWLYGGHWMGQFGHFLTETLTILWPERTRSIDGLVFHRFLHSPAVQEWQLTLVARAGWDLPVVVVRGHPCRVDRLVLPERSFVPGTLAMPEAVGVWDRVARSQTRGGPVFLSRTRGTTKRVLEGDEELDDRMAALGFDVVHSQELPITEQVELAASASVLVGIAGSQLHLAAFAPASTQVIEIGDQRSPHKLLGNQAAIESARGRPGDFVPYLPTPSGGRDANATAEAVRQLLR